LKLLSLHWNFWQVTNQWYFWLLWLYTCKFTSLPFTKSDFISHTCFDLVHFIYGFHDLYLPKVNPVIISHLLIIIFIIVGFILWTIIPTFFYVYNMFHTTLKTQDNIVIKWFFLDNLGGEYTSNKFYEFLVIDDTIHQTSCTNTTQYSVDVERKHRHILYTTCSLLLCDLVPNELWGEEFLLISMLLTRFHLLLY